MEAIMMTDENRVSGEYFIFERPFQAQKKPLVVDVWEINKTYKIPAWAKENAFWEVICDDIEILTIHTIDGLASASIGDFLIKGIKGEIYPCRRDIFLETYEVVSDD